MVINMANIEFKEELQEIINRIEEEVLDRLSENGEDWFASSVVNDVLNIIKEYI